MIDEPSVLDYVKSKIFFWKYPAIHIPRPKPTGDLIPAGEDEGIPAAGADEAVAVPQEMKGRPEAVTSRRALVEISPAGILLTASVLLLALLAQSLLEPPNRVVPVSVFFYGVSGVLIGLAYFRNIILPVRLPEGDPAPGMQTFRWEGLLVGFLLLAAAFAFFASVGEWNVPEFNLLNTSLWILGIGYVVWAFLPPAQEPRLKTLRRRATGLLSAPGWKVTLTRWGLLMIAAIALILFFRFYRLNSVPAEMVSDHAEKLLDVYDVLQGEFRVFFPRNTGREAFQFYWTALMVKLFHTGISFMALKLGTVLGGLLALVYLYRLGKEIGNRWVALYAILFAGFSYWANTQARIGLRFTLYPMFLAPVLFHMIRGLQKANRTDFIWAGLWLGIGLHGYTSYRIVPFVIAVAFLIYILHERSRDRRIFALWGFLIVALVSLAVFIPLLRFTIDNPGMVAFRSLTRLGDLERPLPGPAWLIFLKNTWNALVMFFWSNGDVWVHSIPYRPALDVISAALFFIGLVLVLLRYIRSRSWIDLFLLVSIPMLLLPSILSLAFPNENPNLNRTAGAYIPAFLILGYGLDALLNSLKRSLPEQLGVVVATGVGLVLVIFSASNNYDLFFRQYDESMRNAAWNTSEMGEVVREFGQSFGDPYHAWVVAYPYWVDTRLVGINAGLPTRDTAITPDQIWDTQTDSSAKLFLLHPQDLDSLSKLQEIYPEGRYWVYPSRTPGKEFVIFFVPPGENLLPHSAGGGN
jgi:hypothetical protein